MADTTIPKVQNISHAYLLSVVSGAHNRPLACIACAKASSKGATLNKCLRELVSHRKHITAHLLQVLAHWIIIEDICCESE